MKKIFFLSTVFILLVTAVVSQDCGAGNTSIANCKQIKSAVGPFRAIAQIEMKRASNNIYKGTAFLIHPRVILTAGHNLRKKPWFFFARVHNITFHFGSVDSNTSVADITLQIDRDKNMYYLESFRKHYSNEEDFGIIILPDSSLYNKIGYCFKLGIYDESMKDTQITIGEYPGFDPVAFYRTEWTTSTTNYYKYNSPTTKGSCLRYDMYTEHGSSGSPIWKTENSSPVVFGIHTNGFSARAQEKCNSATLVTQQVYDQIKSWCALNNIIL